MAERFTCPRCGATSHHPVDALEGYCGACHDWTGPQRPTFLGHFDREGRPITMRRYSELHSDLGYLHVRMTAVGEVQVSTVWLGINHQFLGHGPPLIFETMVFGGELDEYQWRWPTLEAAEAGHDQVVAEVRERVAAR